MNTKLLEKKMENISPFELKNRLIDMADESLKKTARTMLNAGRGNPNWIATTPREAFFLLGKFGLEECRHVMFLPEGIAGIPEKQGIAARFEQFLKSNTYQPGAKLLEQTYHYMLMQHAVDPDSLVHEWAESVIGNQYPVPDRILQFTEMLVCDYLNQECATTVRLAELSTCLPPKAERLPCVTSSIRCKRISCWTKATASPSWFPPLHLT